MKEFLEKYKFVILITIIVIVLGVRGCVNRQSSELRGQNKELSRQVTKLQDGVAIAEKERLRFKDSVRLENNKKNKLLKELEEKNKKSEDRIKSFEAAQKTEKEKIKNLTLVNVADTLNKTYGGNAVAGEKSIDISGPMPYQILETISDFNFYKFIVKEKDFQLSVKDSALVITTQQLNDSRVLLNATEKSLLTQQELSALQAEQTFGLTRENKKLRQANTFNKYLLPVATALGAFAGYKIGTK